MNIDGQHFRTIWQHAQEKGIIQIIDQRKLPFHLEIEDLSSLSDALRAITDMHVRGAGLIGATAGYGMYLASLSANEDRFEEDLVSAGKKLCETRPTAVNLKWAVDRQLNNLKECENLDHFKDLALKTAELIADEDADMCQRIGVHGLELIQKISHRKSGEAVNILTHCNAGWLAFVDYGSATAPIYLAHDKGIDVHVWVDETRPRNQGARLTAWELLQHGVAHTVIPDNAGGHLMQHGMVDLVITGADRVTRTGDAANKIGTYLKALAAQDNQIPFYVALPSSTFDWSISDGITQIPIEQRDGREVKWMQGFFNGQEEEFLIMPDGSPVVNYGFDVTPARLITGLITERGICKASAIEISKLYPEQYT
jgi:methylthioribose-1-phosphate isomerase